MMNCTYQWHRFYTAKYFDRDDVLVHRLNAKTHTCTQTQTNKFNVRCACNLSHIYVVYIHVYIHRIAWHHMASHGIAWHRMASHGIVFHSIPFHSVPFLSIPSITLLHIGLEIRLDQFAYIIGQSQTLAKDRILQARIHIGHLKFDPDLDPTDS